MNFKYFLIQTWFHNNPQPIEADAAGDEEQHHGPDGWDAGEVQQQPGGPGHGADPAALRGEAEDWGPTPQDAAANRGSKTHSGQNMANKRREKSLKSKP